MTFSTTYGQAQTYLSQPISVLVADDCAMVRHGMRAICAGTEISVVGFAENGRQAVEQVANLKPDVVVLDVKMPKMDGLSALSELTELRHSASVMIFTAHEDPGVRALAICRRALGFLSKRAHPGEILTVIRNIHQRWGDEQNGIIGVEARRSMQFVAEAIDRRILSADELAVLAHTARGYSNRQISAELEIPFDRVKLHQQRILQKTGCRDRTEAALWGVRRGLV